MLQYAAFLCYLIKEFRLSPKQKSTFEKLHSPEVILPLV
jgi:hypothetical protein